MGKHEADVFENRDLLKLARMEPVAVELHQLMRDGFELTHSTLSDTVPKWLLSELECEGLTLRLERLGHWVLASLDD
jgi:hypothetical protein